MPLAILVTLGALLSWAALLAASRVLLLRLGLDPWAFSFVQLCAGGLVLLAAGGRRRPDLSSFRRPATWALGVLRVLSAACYTAVLVRLSVLEAGVLGAVNVPLVALAVWLAFGRRPARGEWLGQLVILAAILPLVAGLEGGLRDPAVGLMLLNELCLVAATLLAERHPDNRSDRPGARFRLTGAVLLVTAALFLAVRLAEGGSAGGLLDRPLLAAGAAVGVALRAPSMVLSFWSIRLVGARNYMAAVSLLPLLGLGLEQAALAAGLIEVSRFRPGTALLALGVVAGTLLVVAARIRARRPAPPRGQESVARTWRRRQIRPWHRGHPPARKALSPDRPVARDPA
ncbi:EamA-like transporter family protein [Tistlia consotensis]|uniref:EamA-like transporter family protein n=1 Tax=Tistlia consotensis USBA 355 TaxID=560819 RepID=A0A1Y6C954_9PROT|nr:EamA family transporter [Tistlia consotensis]SMF51231.1 EamA-like transporter family protein [Tistlia consotensis USBA 355]SNR84637.1 EamA-like transporter family protein [Tistlia consotensis]